MIHWKAAARACTLAVLVSSMACVAGCGATTGGESVDEIDDELRSDIPVYQAQVSPQLRRGSQPDHAAFVELRDKGYRSIVNLRESDDERPDVLALGMDPHHISVRDRQAPSVDQVVDFLEFATSAENLPVFVHCRAGQGRTGVFVAAYRMAVDDWNVEDAINEGRARGMTAERQIAFLRSLDGQLRDGSVKHYHHVR